MIYEPREDSYLLMRNLSKYVKNRSVLDVGTGSGIQAQEAIKFGASKVLALDVNSEAVDAAIKKGINAIRSDLFSKITGKYDVIVFNPPYLPYDSQEDAESSLITSGGPKGDELISRFLTQAPRFMTKKGIILIIVSSLTPKSNLLKLLRSLGLSKRIIDKENLFLESLELWKLTKSQ